jgi:hypothetical protein
MKESIIVTDQDEIVELKSRLAILEARTTPKPIRPPHLDEGVVKISTIAAHVSCALPDAEQMRALANRMLELFPELGPHPRHGAPQHEREDVERRWREGFAAAFVALGSMRRTDQPDHSRYISFFVAHCEGWLRSFGNHTDIREPFALAALAWADIPWCDWRVDGQVAELGLSAYIGRVASAESWQKVLALGVILPPTGARLAMPARSPARVRTV